MKQKIFIIVAIFLAVLPGHVTAAAAKPSSTSTSRQFLVYGAELPIRGAMCELAERTKLNLLRLLQITDDWKTPLVVNLNYPQANFPETPATGLDFSQTGFGLKLQLNLLLTSDSNSGAVQRQLLRAILLERIYHHRAGIPAGTPYVEPPDWLIDGLLELAPERDPNSSVQLLQAIVAAKKIASLEDVVRQRRESLDPPSREIYSAYSMALLRLLIDSPDGRRKIAKFIDDLPDAPNDSLADLRAHFPEVLGDSSDKWWSLSVARLSAADRYETLSLAATSEQLDQLLKISIPGADGATHEFRFADYGKFLKLQARPAALSQLSQQLLLLCARAHPSYRPIVQEYHQLAGLLAQGTTHKVRHRLARVASYRRAVDGEASDLDDYMNWFEATQFSTMSGAFSDLLAADRAQESEPRRRDPISVYLDVIEMEMK